MATTNQGWALPTVGGSQDTWGATINSTIEAIDALVGGVSATELAILDGATVTTAELNYVDGVTSAIQTQLDAKMATATYPDLVAIEALSSTGIPIRTATNTWTQYAFKDEDNMTSNSATAVPSQQSVKAYVDTAAAAAKPTVFFLKETRTSGSNSAFSVAANTWGKRLLTSAVKTISGASVASNVVTLPAGTYTVTATASTNSYNNVDIQTRLRDTTNSVTLAASTAFSVDGNGGNGNPPCSLTGAFVLTDSANIELQQYVNGTSALGGGFAVGSGDTEVYAALTIIKIA
jgi:hypothetical protein